MEGNRFISELRLENFLSFGAEPVTLALQPLNVLIGPNGSGKSNLLDAIDLLRATPSETELLSLIRASGGVEEWLWKGAHSLPIATIDAVVDYPEGVVPLRYRLSFTSSGQRFDIADEAVENSQMTRPGEEDVYFFYRFQEGHPVLNVRSIIEQQPGTPSGRVRRTLRREELSAEKSVLSQRRDPDQYPELTYLADQFSKMRIYKDWIFGRNNEARRPQRPDAPEDCLEADASNLGLVLNQLQHAPGGRKLLLEKLKDFMYKVSEINTTIRAGTVQVFLQEQGLKHAIPATRLSDGTLRYLSLLAILCNPIPPPLVCIEEPEIGLHPDILPDIASLLVEASKRTQLVVTTHSESLVSALSDFPDTVVVCEQDASGTKFSRLEKDRLQTWLEKYSLGELWRRGEIGGTRW
ncbi:MAG TPA: AAA family ATPase [Candidatus Obscuribacterales bacterium]